MRALPSSARRYPRSALAAALVLAALAAAGCSDSTGTGVGTFDAQVTGATNRSYAGEALGLREGGYGYALVMEADIDLGPQSFDLFLYKSDASTPSLGEHAVLENPGPDQFEGSILLNIEEADELLCIVTAGTITFSNSSGSRAAGTFDLDVSCSLTGDPAAEPTAATVTGSFDAVMATAL